MDIFSGLWKLQQTSQFSAANYKIWLVKGHFVNSIYNDAAVFFSTEILDKCYHHWADTMGISEC